MPANTGVIHVVAARFVALSAVGALLFSGSLPAVGDIFHLSSGGRVEGELLETADGHYQVLTVLGTVSLAVDGVLRVDPAPTPFEGYRQRAAAAADTPAAQVALATWCAEQGLHRDKRVHFNRALELDPDCTAARRALGYVRVGEFWVDGRSTGDAGRSIAARRGRSDGRGDIAEDPVKLAAAIQVDWQLRIQAIKSTFVESPLADQVAHGRAEILQIRDPLAIVPLVDVLSGGSLACRKLLLEALSAFSDDVATINLAALALADPHREIRSVAISLLVRREDPRVTTQLRRALESGDDALVRRAAVALGALRATEAIPELISELKVRRRKPVELPARRYFYTFRDAFPVQFTQIGSSMVGIEPRVSGALIGASRRTWEVRDVTVLRTEVLEALRAISGEDFGFDETAWARWYKERRS